MNEKIPSTKLAHRYLIISLLINGWKYEERLEKLIEAHFRHKIQQQGCSTAQQS